MTSRTSPSVGVAPYGASDLRAYGIAAGQVHWNAGVARLYEHAIRREEGVIAADGPLVCRTGSHTGRSPNDKYIVRTAETAGRVAWGKVNRILEPEHYAALEEDLFAHLAGRELFVQDCRAGADPAFALPIRVITEDAWHSLFARNLFIVDAAVEALGAEAPFTVIDAPQFQADPARHGTSSATCIVLNFDKRLVVIGGTRYAGEIKKSIFTAMNYLLPPRGVMPMHCSANVGAAGDVALFFGLSGTGKTTLSSDVERRLIGDDEHGWSDAGVFNFEGGCYAKTIRLSAEAEPQIFATTRRFGTVLENVAIDPETRVLDLDSDALTENTRGAYPLAFIDGHVASGTAGHPRHIVMLTADAFGCLPPIARLSAEGALYHFLSGYTAKVAGTERGVTEPRATFSTCFGAPFLPLPPQTYATLLGERIARHDVTVWLINTGWSGGPYGVGKRISIAHTRAIIRAALSGALDAVDDVVDPIFNLATPVRVPGVPDEVLTPRATWADPAAYDAQARRLAGMFAANFAAFESGVSAAVKAAGPRASRADA